MSDIMTDEDEDRLREIIRREVQALLLRVPFDHTDNNDLQFANDLQWHFPRAYQRVVKEVLAEFNTNIERIDQRKDERKRGEHGH